MGKDVEAGSVAPAACLVGHKALSNSDEATGDDAVSLGGPRTHTQTSSSSLQPSSLRHRRCRRRRRRRGRDRLRWRLSRPCSSRVMAFPLAMTGMLMAFIFVLVGGRPVKCRVHLLQVLNHQSVPCRPQSRK